MYFPALNRSRCCKQSICTDCYLQARLPMPPVPVIHRLAKLKRKRSRHIDS